MAWDPQAYATHAAFVPALGSAVLDLLSPRAGERILDLGCGDGVLTARLVESGAEVVGIDADPAMVASAVDKGLDARLGDGRRLGFDAEFDAVFTNAAMHWMGEPSPVVVFRALKPGGRFVGEFGGHGNIAAIRVAVRAVLMARGYNVPPVEDNYYPTAEGFTAKLAAAGFAVGTCAIVPRPTPIASGMSAWLQTFRGGFIDSAGVPPDKRAQVIEDTRAMLRPVLADADGNWTADYVRIRFSATKPEYPMRYLPHTDADRRDMLRVIGAADIDALFADVPAAARLAGPIAGLSNHLPEMLVERQLSAMAARNMTAGGGPSFLGCGAYKHHVPASVDHIIQRGEFLTSYTPYQPEIAQGTLQYLFEFQTQVARLTGMDVANASMYDGSTAMTEAVFMARRVTRRTVARVSSGVHPHYVSVLGTLTRFTDDTVVTRVPDLSPDDDLAALAKAVDQDTSCVVVQNPTIFGHVADLAPLAAACHAAGALLVVVVTEVVSLGAIKSPGEMGADIVVAEGQSIGNGLNFGGPYLGLFATRDRFVRQMPGRLCGETVDADGRRGFVLTLSTREQHIRREKATSNICTNSGLCALAFTVHMSLLGEAGLRKLAAVNHGRAVQLAERLARIPGVELVTETFFNEFTLKLPVEARPIVRKLADKGVLAGVSLGRLYPGNRELERGLVVAVTETASDEDFNAFEDALDEVLS